MSGTTQKKNGNNFPVVSGTNTGTVASSNAVINCCQFFNVATDFSEIAPNSSTDEESVGETWFPEFQGCQLGGVSFSELEAEGEDSPADASQSFSCFDRPIDNQVEAFVHGNTSATPAHANESVLRHLLSTVLGHAAIAESLARQYASATNLIRMEVCSALSACHAQCIRLCRARQAYLSSLSHLNKVQQTMLTQQLACMVCKSSLVKDLVKLERLRCTAKRLQDSRHLIESLNLSKQHEACRRALGQKASADSDGLGKHFLAEKAALQLLHASRLLDVQDVLSVLHQIGPVEEYAAREILHRLSLSKPNGAKACTEGGSREECELPNDDLERGGPPAISALSADSCGSFVCVVSLLRLLQLEKALSTKFTNDVKRLLNLTRLARNFSFALEHLEMFLESVIGPQSRASPTEDSSDSRQYPPETECIEQIKMLLEICNDTSINTLTPRLECSLSALGHCQVVEQPRLRRCGVVFFNGALRRTQHGLSCPVNPISLLDNLKSRSAVDSSALHRALQSCQGHARNGLGKAQVGLYHSSSGAGSHVQHATNDLQKSNTIVYPQDEIMQNPSPPSCNPMAPDISRMATLGSRELSNSDAKEIQDASQRSPKTGNDCMGCTEEQINPQGQLETSAARREFPGDGGGDGGLQRGCESGIAELCNMLEETSSAFKAQGIPVFRDPVEIASLASKSLGNTEASSSSAKAKLRGNISRQLSWHRKTSIVSLLKNTRDKLSCASSEIFSRHCGPQNCNQPPSAKGSSKARSTFVDTHNRPGVGRVDSSCYQGRPTNGKGLQTLIARVGNRSCKGIVRHWVSMKWCDRRTAPRRCDGKLWKHQCRDSFRRESLGEYSLESGENSVN